MSHPSNSSSEFLYKFGSITYDLSKRTYIMGILNVTPDSFSDGGRFFDADKALARGRVMVEEGADFIDVGGESTRPGSDPLPVEEELRRVLPIIKTLAHEVRVPISVDTYKSEVADSALKAGATIVNDISGLRFDRNMAEVVKRNGASVVLMHMKGTPKTMQADPTYVNVVEEVSSFLEKQSQFAWTRGIEQIMVDPGIGFGKSVEHNLRLIRELDHFRKIGLPILIGPSRKSFIGKMLDMPVDERLEGTAAAVTASILHGANVVRVHDVKQMKRVARVTDGLKSEASCA
jgi:dihydropteroate synthase